MGFSGGGGGSGGGLAAFAFGLAAARPAAAAGNANTAYYATDTGEITFSNGAAWFPISSIPSPAPTVVGSGGGAPAYAGAWVPEGTAGITDLCFWQDALGMVWLAGTAKNGGAGNPVFTLPAGMRPANVTPLLATNNDVIGGGYTQGTVAASGVVIADQDPVVFLASFRAGV